MTTARSQSTAREFVVHGGAKKASPRCLPLPWWSSRRVREQVSVVRRVRTWSATAGQTWKTLRKNHRLGPGDYAT